MSEVAANVPSSGRGDGAVDDHFSCSQVRRGIADIAREFDVVTPHCEVCAIQILLLRALIHNYLSICDVFALLGRDVFIFPEKKGIGARGQLRTSLLQFIQFFAERIGP